MSQSGKPHARSYTFVEAPAASQGCLNHSALWWKA